MPHPNETASARIEHLRLMLAIPTEARNEFRIPCAPYQVRLLFHDRDNLDVEVHLLKTQDLARFEPLLNTKPGFPLEPKMLRFRDNWLKVRDDPEQNFRLTTTLASIFNILLPETKEA